jgi:hypothetical protein
MSTQTNQDHVVDHSYKTISIQQPFNKDFIKIAKYMTHISKNVFNVTIYNEQFFSTYKNLVFEQVYNITKNDRTTYPIEPNKLLIIQNNIQKMDELKKQIVIIDKKIEQNKKYIKEDTNTRNKLKVELGFDDKMVTKIITKSFNKIKKEENDKKRKLKQQELKNKKQQKLNDDENKEEKDKINLKVNKLIYDIFDKYYIDYETNRKIRKNNNIIVYPIVKEYLQTNQITNNNFYTTYNYLHNYLSNKVQFDNNNKKFVYSDVIFNIIQSHYNFAFFSIKDKLMKEIKIDYIDPNFINQVRQNDYLFKNQKTKPKYKELLNMYYTVHCDETIIKTLAYKHLGNNLIKVQSNTCQQTIAKAYDTITSYYGKLSRGLKANKTKFLPKNSQYPVRFISKTIENIDGKLMLRLGENIAENYNEITNKSKKEIRKSKKKKSSTIIKISYKLF